MTKAQIQEIQRKVGVSPDGWWGPASIAASQKHLRKLMPKDNPWPKESELRSSYGEPGDESNLVIFKFPPGWTLYGETPIISHRCHKKVKESLERVLANIEPASYDGCFNFRKRRGGSSLSVHAWGAAIDINAATNGNSTHWPTKATMSFDVMEAFAREGWMSAGAFWSRDAMHHQATK
jgi:hypothetical protein